MAASSLDMAKYLMKCRKFSVAIELLESYEEIYDGDFDYYVTCGIAYLYMNTPGQATAYFKKAREIKINNTRLLLGQAAIFLRHGEIERALQYYLDVLDLDPKNKLAKKAMEFIRTDGEYSTICKLVDTGDIKMFYPPLGINPLLIRNVVLSGLGLGILCSLLYLYVPKMKFFNKSVKENVQIGKQYELSEDEINHPLQSNVLEGEFAYILTPSQVTDSYNAAKKYFSENRDNAALVEINRLLNSNAYRTIKEKAASMLDLLQEPTFSTLKDNYSYSEVAKNPALYLDCYTIWEGTISNPKKNEDGSFECDLLVNYFPADEKKSIEVEGLVHYVFKNQPSMQIINDAPRTSLLGKISFEGDRLYVKGTGFHQKLNGK